MPARRDLESDLRHRLRPDRHRAGLRVRLCRLPGAQGAARGRLPHDRRQLEPGHDHDRPGLRGPHVHRAARPGERRLGARARAAGRAAADARRPDRAQPRRHARRGGRARGAGDRADRRSGRGHPPRRGPRGVQARGRVLRPPGSDLDDRHRPRPARRTDGSGGRPARIHARRPRRRLRRRRGRAPAPGRARPGRVPDRAGARRGLRARLGRVRARGDPRSRGQRRRRLLDREPRPDGRPHGRLGHGRPADDACRRGVPGASRRGRSRRPRGGRRDRRLEHPVRAQPATPASSASSR